jgi:Family of unknown function (DUF6527)
MRLETICAEYVDFIPATLKDGVLYISKKFRTASHRCCCGCGTRIVTPLRETDYRLTERQGLVSLHPSIGNWNYPCQSHYLIKSNRVIWAPSMTKEEIRLGRADDDVLREAYFARAAWPWWRRLASSIKHWLVGRVG